MAATKGRRQNGEGAVYKTGDGRWRAAVVLPDGRRKYLSGRTREDVSRRLRQVQRAAEDECPSPPTAAHPQSRRG